MMHLKNSGLAALAVVALTALVGISSASAAEFHATGGATLTGNQEGAHVFTFSGQNVTCNTATLNGTAAASGTSTTQNLHPSYSNCTAFGLPATINTDGCQYEFNANTTTVNIASCTNGRITIHSSNVFSTCEVDIPNQNSVSGVTFINMGSTPEGNATLTIVTHYNNLTYNVTVSNGLCPLSVGHGNTGAYSSLTGIMTGVHIN